MFTLNIRFQLAAVLVLACIIYDYLRSQPLKLLSTKYFGWLLVASGCNLIADITTVYTITHLDKVPANVNRVCHQIFIATVIAIMFAHYMYTQMLANSQKRIGVKRMLITVIPLFVSLIIILTGRLYYYVGDDGAYSYGPMVYSIYVCGLIYIIGSIYCIINKRNRLEKNQREAIGVGILIWTIILMIQMSHPQYLLSGIGFVLMVLVIYFAFENPKENQDIETQTYNKMAFHKMMNEYYSSGKYVYIVSVVCENYERVNSVIGREKGIQALRYLVQIMRTYTKNEIFRSRSNVLSMFFVSNAELTQDERKIIERFEYALGHSEYREAELICHVDVMDVKRYTSSQDEVYEFVNYMQKNADNSKGLVHFMDENTAKKKYRIDKIDMLLTNALKEDGFEMVYQPIFWPRENKYGSAEALIRMKSTSELGFISPEEFIPIAEEKGMIMEIGDKVIDMVSKFIRNNDLEKTQLEYIEVNLSGIQIVAPDISKRIEQILKKNKVMPHFINLEITETATVSSGVMLRNNMKKLKGLGFSFSMDDFGTGYSNLAQISQIDYDLIKLDKSLIWPAFSMSNESEDEAEKSMTLLKSVIHMMNNLCLGIVAEGVETKEMVGFLSSEGVEHLQGYYYSKPVRENEFLKMITNEV